MRGLHALCLLVVSVHGLGLREPGRANGTITPLVSLADSLAMRARRRLSVNLQEVAKLVAADAATDANFGISVAIDGDTVVIGALGDDDGGSWSGSA